MPVTRRVGRLCGLALFGLLLAGPAAGGESLPRVEGRVALEEVVELALAHNRKLRAAGAEERAMASMRGEAFAGFLPQASLNGYLASQRMGPNLFGSAGETMARNYQVFGMDRTQDLNLTVMWSLFSGGRTYYGYRAAGARADAAGEMRRGAEVEVALRARLDYIGAVRERENQRVTEELRRQTEERLRVTREEYAAGRVPQLNVFRDEAELANVLQMDAQAQSRAELALVTLKTTLGVDLASSLQVAEPLEQRAVPAPAEAAVREAVEGHPEVRAAAKQAEAAELEVRAAYGRYLPELSAAWMYDWQRMRNRGEPFGSAEGYAAGLVLTVPLFDGFMRENAVATAKAKRDRAREVEVQARQLVQKDLQQAALMLRAASQGVEASRQGVAQAEEQFRVARERFASGRGIQLEVLDAQATLTRARFNVVAALAEHETARALWLGAAGRIR